MQKSPSGLETYFHQESKMSLRAKSNFLKDYFLRVTLV